MKGKIFKIGIVTLILIIVINNVLLAQQKVADIEKLMQKYYENGQFNGSVLIAENGKVIFKRGYGLANIEWNVPNTPDTKFRIGSITKSFTAMLIMQLAEEDKIHLEYKIIDYLPNYRKDTGTKVTIHHLLSHTSGLPNYTVSPEYFSKISRLPANVDEFIKGHCENDLEFEPGSRYAYSNTGFFLLGAIVEKVSGKKYGDVLREKILEPLNMKNTGYDNNESIITKRANGYMPFFKGCINAPYVDMSVPFSAGGMYATAEDLFLWDQALYTEKLLTQEFKKKLFTKYTTTPEGFPAFGWTKEKLPIFANGDSVYTISRTGGINGFWALITRVIADKHSVILLNNTARTDLDEMTENILKIIYVEPYDTPKKSIAKAMYDRISQQNIQSAIEFYHEARNHSPTDYILDESEFGLLGYNLIVVENRLDEAIEVFKLNTKVCPKSSMAYFYLGDAYMRKGDKKKAIFNFQRSLELNPDNIQAKEMLKQLRGDKQYKY